MGQGSRTWMAGEAFCVISKKIGSFFFIGILIVDAELEYDQPFEADLCGDLQDMH